MYMLIRDKMMNIELTMISKIALMLALMSTFSLAENGMQQGSRNLQSPMNRFGHSDRSPPSTNTVEDTATAIGMVQRASSLSEVLIQGDATSGAIERGHSSHIQKLVGSRRKKRNARAWSKSPITWRLNRSSSKVSRPLVIHDLEQAFRLWSDGTGLRFQRLDDDWVSRGQEEADIVISFEAGQHGDYVSFDGPGGTLAHAFFPGGSNSLGGDVHMDEDEDWKTYDDVKRTGKGVSIYEVASHELGHSLGLEDSKDGNSLMYYAFLGHKDLRSLPEVDGRRIRAIYGRGTEHTEPPAKEPMTTRRPFGQGQTFSSLRPSSSRPHGPEVLRAHRHLCRTKFDTIAAIRGEIYIFKDQFMWRLTSRKKLEGPKLTSSFWLGLPKDIKKIDAAYEGHSGTHGIFLFSGINYWVFDNRQLKPGYPRQLTSLGLPSNVTKLDAVLAGTNSEDVTFFSKKLYWKFQELTGKLQPGYPKQIKRDWKGVKYPLTSAFRWTDDVAYFFHRKVFWKFNDLTNEVDQPLGKLTSTHWFGCSSNPSIARANKDKIPK